MDPAYSCTDFLLLTTQLFKKLHHTVTLLWLVAHLEGVSIPLITSPSS